VFCEEDVSNSGEVTKPYWPQFFFSWQYSSYSEPSWLEQDEGLSLFKKAAEAWSQCGIKIEYTGSTDHPGFFKDRLNTMGWSTLKPAMRGLTLRQTTKNSSKLIEADIIINRENIHIQNNKELLQKVISHEFGHALGLVHSKTCENIMSSAAQCGNKIPAILPSKPTEDDLAQCFERYGIK
jgi:hypothetical protein